MVGVGQRLRRGRERHGKSNGARDEPEATGGLRVLSLVVLHQVLLKRWLPYLPFRAIETETFHHYSLDLDRDLSREVQGRRSLSESSVQRV
jgi:hypothetical protein